MTTDYDPIVVRESVRKSTAASGVPHRVTDPYVLARLGEMFRTPKSPAVVAARPQLPEGNK